MGHAQRLRLRDGVVDAHLRRVARRHQHRLDPLGAECVAGDGQRERRVDASGETEHRTLEAVLHHVVAYAEHQRLVDRRGRLGRCCDPPRQRSRHPGDHVEARQQQLGLELRRARGHPAGGVEHERASVEHQFVLATDQVDVGHRQRRLGLAGAQRRLALALLAGVERRGVEVDQQPRTGRGARGGDARVPGVLADAQADRNPADLDHARRIAGTEVALLVEHRVVGQLVLAVGGDHASAAQQRRGVVEGTGVRLGVADHHVDTHHLAGEPGERLLAAADEPGAQQQVLGRVAGQRQLREDHRIGALFARPAARHGDLRDIAVEGTDQ